MDWPNLTHRDTKNLKSEYTNLADNYSLISSVHSKRCNSKILSGMHEDGVLTKTN